MIIFNAEELAESVLAVARQLDLLERPFEVVMSGHLFSESLYQTAFFTKIFQSAKKADCQLLTIPPVVGAVLLAMKASGLDFQPARATLHSTDFSGILSKTAPKNT